MNHVPLRRFPRILWALLFFFTIGNLFAQSGTVSVDFKNATPAEIIKNLESRTPYRFVYPEGLDLNSHAITVKKENVSIDEVLKVLQAQTNLDFRRTENNIAVNKKQTTRKQGKVTGKVVDESGLSLPGATIRVVEAGTTTVADSYGNYSLNINSGSYTIEAIFISFQTKKITGVVVNDKGETILNIALKENANALQEVVITQSYKKATSTAEGLLLQQKKAAQMSDGISAEQIAKTPDSDVGATLKRVTGVTTIGDKYVVVRSLGERWNTALMDGIKLPSADYNNNFSFDIIPTAMVESVVVSKTATPDMNASFAGGYIEIKTKDIPNKDFLSFNWGSSYNDQSTFKQFLTRQHGKNDYFGFDDGTRDFPQGLENSDINTENFFRQSKRFTNDNFTTYSTKANPGSSFQLAFGKKFELENGNKWGFAGAITSKNEQTILDIDHTGRSGWLYNAYRADDTTPTTFYDFKNKGASYTNNSVVSGMLNFGLQMGKNRFSFRNSYTHTADISLTRTTGWNEYNGSGDAASAQGAYNYFYNGVLPEGGIKSVEFPTTSEYNYPVYQQLLQNKLEGSHKLANTIELNWFAARTAVEYDMKDFTTNLRLYKMSGNEIYAYNFIYNASPGILRKNIDSNSEDYNFGVNIALQLNKENFKNTIKSGYFGTLRENTNQQAAASLKVDENRPDLPAHERSTLEFNSFGELLNGSHYGPGGVGWSVANLYGGKYHGKVTQHAPFIMFDQRINTKWRLVWGARAEYYKYELLESQRENAVEEGYNDQQTDDKLWEILPSANFTYSPTAKINFRLAYNRSVIRPQFQERTAIPFYDPIASAKVINASGIQSTIVDNYDFKLEWFPRSGEILSFGIYHKKFKKPIERVGSTNNQGNLELYVVNSNQAVLTGFEAEVRKSLGFIAQSSFLDKFFMSANFTYNNTKVTGYIDRFGNYGDGDARIYEANRPLYGQTPWAYNLGLAYDGERFGLNIVHNAKGDQYITVGYDYKDEEIQRPFSTTDAQLGYRFLKDKNFQVKFNVKNLFNTPIETYNNWLSYRTENPDFNGSAQQVRDRYILSPGASKKYDKNTDEVMFRAYRGKTFSLTMNYTF